MVACVAMSMAASITASIANAAGSPTIEPPAQPFRTPYQPVDDAEVLQEVPKASDPDVAEIRRLTARLAREPRNLDLANALAKAYIDFGRQLGDAHYVGYAEAVIAPWLASKAPPASTLVIDATILQYRHQFKPARDLLVRALAIEPRNAQAWLTLATLDMVQGDYPTATRDCEQVARSGGDVIGLVCSANLISYLGQARRSIDTLNAVAFRTRGLPAKRLVVDRGTARRELGAARRLAGRGGALPQGALLRARRQLPPRRLRRLPARSRATGRGADAACEYAQSDTAFLRLVLAQVALKSPDLPRYVWVMSARFEALAQRGDDLFGREQVRFALHAQNDPKAALELARQNWRVQRAPWDARVFLEAAKAADDAKAAVPVLDFVDGTKLEDPVIADLARDLRARAREGGVVMRVSGAIRSTVAAALVSLAAEAHAHSASDAYLTLQAVRSGAATPLVVHGQWDIALRDLDFVVRLDDDGDGAITWRELRRHQSAVARYALEHLAFDGDGKVCKLVLTRQLVDSHADGSYAALFFDATCPASTTRVTVDYRLFFDIDPSHRAIVIARVGGDTSTAVLSPEHAKIDLSVGKLVDRP